MFRLDKMLSTYFGAEQSEYTKLVGRNMMISAIARILGIGEKVDMMVILEGPQGLLKSTAVRTLFYPWFTDDIEQFGSKDASMQCAGVWCIEVGELDAISKTEASRIKSFISRINDRFRPPYGRDSGNWTGESKIDGAVCGCGFVRGGVKPPVLW